MKLGMMMAAAGLALGTIAAPVLAAAPAMQMNHRHDDGRGDRRDGSGPDRGYDNGRRHDNGNHYGRDRHHRRCHTEYRHHRRVTRCYR